MNSGKSEVNSTGIDIRYTTILMQVALKRQYSERKFRRMGRFTTNKNMIVIAKESCTIKIVLIK